MGNLRASLEDIKGQLQACSDKREMLELMVEFSKEIDPYPEQFKTEENKVHGCNATVYIHAEQEDGKLHFIGHSNSFVTAGYISILIKAADGLRPAELDDEAEETVKRFLKDTKLDVTQLSSRANTFGNIFLKMREQASRLKGDG